MAKSKRKIISDIEKHYIETNPDNLEEQDLANKVKCCVTLVRKLREKPEPVIETKPVKLPVNEMKIAAKIAAKEGTVPVYNGPKAGDLFGRNEKRGVVVMTPAAAEAGDDHGDFLRKNKSKTTNRYDMHGQGKSDVIHVIKE